MRDKRFDVIMEEQFMASSLAPCMSVRGPDAFRYGGARAIIWLDRLMCTAGITRGFIRVLVGQKRESASRGSACPGPRAFP